MIVIPEEYVIQTLYRCVSHVHYSKYTKVYNGSCPFCREGASFGKKKRFYYIPEKELAFCHNCGYSKKTFNFILDITHKSLGELIEDMKNIEVKEIPKEIPKEIVEVPTLPKDCINLSDNNQLAYYKENEIVQKCLSYIKSRRLDTAYNRPATYYLSLSDEVHKDRLILPFYDLNGDIIHYQTRGFLGEKVKYLSKVHSEKSLPGIEHVDANKEHLFITEGPIDSYFIENSVALLGINEGSSKNFTDRQTRQIGLFSSLKKVWCLDNQRADKASLKKTMSLVESGESVFIWPEYVTYKDFNEMAVHQGTDKIDQEFITLNTYQGLQAKVLLQFINN